MKENEDHATNDSSRWLAEGQLQNENFDRDFEGGFEGGFDGDFDGGFDKGFNEGFDGGFDEGFDEGIDNFDERDHTVTNDIEVHNVNENKGHGSIVSGLNSIFEPDQISDDDDDNNEMGSENSHEGMTFLPFFICN